MSTLLLTSPAWRPSPEQVRAIKANFCGAKDQSGRVIFDPFISGQSGADREDWYQRKRAAGLTHVVVQPAVSYPGAPYAAPDLRSDPQGWRALLLDVLGHGFVPVVMMTSGDPGTAREITDTVWPAQLLDAAADLVPWCIWCQGWETGGGWRASEVSAALRWQQTHLPGGVIAFEAQPGRWTGASYPVEPDDPWQGDELGFWRSHGGEGIDVFLYETAHGSALLQEPCDPADDGCWLNRWHDGVIRLGAGYAGWRIVPICLWETVAYDYWHGQASDADAGRIAAAGDALAAAAGVRVTFGNGLPATQ
jgi:hypothetical protein